MLEEKTSVLTKRATAVGFLPFFILFMEYKAYDYVGRTAHGMMENIFCLYFFIINQSIGIVHEAGHEVCLNPVY